ncbi:O-methyltransferase [Bathycoccus prasinos]|uniref:O-methyltransferase n=1 Tax=Bathycoccus prasinos TaxID=41875 RepID=K8EHH5_9CHLO|nr:O-methyltransferase [Bathycoccus prasinos]CCO17461.1 O-methyltransferase [Bathycoccus prasinos]|eukprot:XP_007511340.1 O-methyltransferase [Bathycoccus prasinos]
MPSHSRTPNETELSLSLSLSRSSTLSSLSSLSSQIVVVAINTPPTCERRDERLNNFCDDVFRPFYKTSVSSSKFASSLKKKQIRGSKKRGEEMKVATRTTMCAAMKRKAIMMRALTSRTTTTTPTTGRFSFFSNHHHGDDFQRYNQHNPGEKFTRRRPLVRRLQRGGASSSGGESWSDDDKSSGTNSNSASGGTINSPLLRFDDALYEYLLKNTREPKLLKQLREETKAFSPVGARMQIPPEQGNFLRLVVEMINAEKIIEIGVFTGYSSLAMLLPMTERSYDGDVRFHACDIDDDAMAVARKFWKAAKVEHMVREHVGDAKVSVEHIKEEFGENYFDLAFVDADKRAYMGYYEQLLPMMKKGGLIIIDNVLWYGRPVNPDFDKDKKTIAIKEFNEFVVNDSRVSHSLVPIGDGISICRVR